MLKDDVIPTPNGSCITPAFLPRLVCTHLATRWNLTNRQLMCAGAFHDDIPNTIKQAIPSTSSGFEASVFVFVAVLINKKASLNSA